MAGTETVGQLLRAHRCAAGLTQDALAARSGVGVQTIGYLERGLVRRPQERTLRQLADALGLSAAARRRLAAAWHKQPLRAPRRATAPGNLPVAPPDTTGHAAAIVDLLDPTATVDAATVPPSRLVTLTGPRGSGKTLVAVQVAAALRGSFSGGAWFVPLATLREADEVPGAVAAALSHDAGAGVSVVALLERLRAQRLLLVCDGCDGLLDACAALIDALLTQCPEMRVLATSREPLQVNGEIVRRISGVG